MKCRSEGWGRNSQKEAVWDQNTEASLTGNEWDVINKKELKKKQNDGQENVKAGKVGLIVIWTTQWRVYSTYIYSCTGICAPYRYTMCTIGVEACKQKRITQLHVHTYKQMYRIWFYGVCAWARTSRLTPVNNISYVCIHVY